MRMVKLLIVTILASLITACVPSLHPLYNDKDLIFDRSLVGVWVSDDGDGSKAIWTFTKSGKNNYALLAADDGEPARFEARLVKLNDQLFLDILPVEPPVENDFYRSLTIRAHLFAKIDIAEDEFLVSLMDPDWVRQQLENDAVTLSHQKLANGEVLLTASTGELQAFMVMHGSDRGAFGDPAKFRREKVD